MKAVATGPTRPDVRAALRRLHRGHRLLSEAEVRALCGRLDIPAEDVLGA